MSINDDLNTILTHLKKTEQGIKILLAQNAGLTATNTKLDADKAALVAAQNKAIADLTESNQALSESQAASSALQAQIAALQAQIGAGGQIDAATQALLDQVKAQSLLNDDLVPDEVVTPPPPIDPPPDTGDDAAILAELTDNTAAGFNKRLGPTAPAGMVLPEVWERPQAVATDLGWRDGAAYMGTFSDGLKVATTPPDTGERARFDYGSTDLAIVFVPENPLDVVGLKNTGVARVRSEEHSNGSVQLAPVQPWNGNNGTIDPDRDSMNHIRYNMHEKLGTPIAIAYGKRNRYDVRPVLYGSDRGQGFWGMVGTATAEPAWAGTGLPLDFIPLSIAVTSQNEFVLIGGHNKKTGKGQVGIYWLGAGQDLQRIQNKGFPFDWPVTYPGLMNSGMITFTKLFGFFDVPIKWPTNIDCVLSPGANSRIQGPDGNASYLNIWNLSTEAQRTAFLAQNDTWVSKWGKAIVTSKYEDKAVTIDLTPLIAGVRDQYFGSQAKFDQVVYQHPGQPWTSYDLNDPMVWPWGVEAKPEWAPTIVKEIPITKPNFMIMRQNADAAFATVSPDGFLRYYNWDGSANGQIYVGKNPVHMNHDKGTYGVDVQRANSGPIITCREDRTIVVLDTWGPSAKIILKIEDSKLEDPVAAESQDIHGAETRLISVADFNGKAVRNYRGAPLKLTTQGGAVFGMGADGNATIERTGSIAIKGNPHKIGGSNVN